MLFGPELSLVGSDFVPRAEASKRRFAKATGGVESMANIGFIGLGHMGLPMAQNLIKVGHAVAGFDLSEYPTERLAADGSTRATSVANACKDAEIIITMLPTGDEVREVYFGDDGVLAAAPAGALLIDSSTIDIGTARDVAQAAEAKGLAMVDTPVSGGVTDARAATLTFMVGGPEAAFERARPVLEAMGKTIVHAGGAGNGQAAQICNNMILGASMLVVSEAFLLAEKLGLDAQKLFDISSKSSGQCWSMTSYCPVPGLVPTSPANRDYKAGFTAAMMLKDLRLAQDAARATRATTPLGAGAAAVYEQFVEGGGGSLDFSGIIRFLRG
jgi:3-hydroxyisobutyrate dehydrogenase